MGGGGGRTLFNGGGAVKCMGSKMGGGASNIGGGASNIGGGAPNAGGAGGGKKLVSYTGGGSFI